MIPGFRYHVVSIAAIFLALGVGIVIGSSFVQSAIVDRLTRRLVDLRTQFDREVVALRDENKRYADFTSALSPLMVTASLTGKRVALVQTGDYPDAVRKAREALEQAGATVTNTTIVRPGYTGLVDVHLPTLLPKLKATHPQLTSDVGGIMKVLAVLITRGGHDSDISALADAHLIQQDGDYSKPNDIVVLIGGASEQNDSRAEPIDLPLIALLKDQGATVLEAEPLNADISYVATISDAGISTVDNVDTDIGRVALVLALRAERGNYGVKKTAQSGILPQTIPAISNGNHNNPGVQ